METDVVSILLKEHNDIRALEYAAEGGNEIDTVARISKLIEWLGYLAYRRAVINLIGV